MLTREPVERFIERHARPVDATFAAACDGRGSVEDFLVELRRFQNADGGFGHALEPDLRTPASSAFATSVAFQYFTAVGVDGDLPIVADAVAYLLSTYRTKERSWLPIARADPVHPSAPWWDDDDAASWTDWGNPSAELLGRLLGFSDNVANGTVIAALTERAVERIDEIAGMPEPEFHELNCFTRLYDSIDEPTRARLWPQLSSLVVDAVERDRAQGGGYGATTLTFVTTPQSAFAPLFESGAIEADLDRLVGTCVDNDHWEPNWTWGEDRRVPWATARQEWVGVITVRNLHVLAAFDMLRRGV